MKFPLRSHQWPIVNHARMAFYVPTAAEPERDNVLSWNQIIGHFVSDIKIPLRVVAHGRAQDVVIDLPAIDVQLVVAERIDIGHGSGRSSEPG